MKEFIHEGRVKIIFGESGISEVISEIKKCGSKVLLVMGGSSFQKNGFHHSLTQQLKEHGITHIDFGGNTYPSLARVREAIALCKREQVDYVLGIGGGVCMDMAKAIALGVKQDDDIWRFLTGELETAGQDSLPIGEIVTNPSSGSELNGAAQIDDDETKMHAGFSEVYPTFAWLNPTYAMSLDSRTLAYGVLTTFVQLSTGFLSPERFELSEKLTGCMMKMLLENLKKSVVDPTDVESRSNLLLVSAMNTSELFYIGRNYGDWSLIPLTGIIQNYYNTSYSKGMTILFPYWLKHIYSDHSIFKDYFKDIFDMDNSNKTDEQVLSDGLDAIFDLYKSLGVATSFKELSDKPLDMPALKEAIAKGGEAFCSFIEFTPEKMEQVLLDAINGN
jgi:alcohol dehydrogenase YqhD (iron-dependent ADH family)